MQTRKHLAKAALAASIALTAAPVLANSGEDYTTLLPLPAIQVSESGFGTDNNTAVHLFKLGPNVGHEGRDLYAVTDNADGIQIWQADNNWGTQWSEREDSKLAIDGSNTSVADIRAFEGHVYVLLNGETGFQLYRWNAEDGWVVELEQQDLNTSATALGSMYGKLLVATQSTLDNDSATLWASDNGKDSWEQLGETGLGLSVGSIVSMDTYSDVTYAVTDDNRVITVDHDAVVTEIADLSAEVTGLSTIKTIGKDERAILIGGSSEAGAVVYASNDGATWTQVISDGFGDANNTSVTHFRLDHLRKSVQAYTENSTAGFQTWETGAQDDLTAATWVAHREDGVTDADNTSVVNTIKYRGRIYSSTENATDGGQIYLTQVRAQRPVVETPSLNEVLHDSSVTISGTATAGDRITLRKHGEVLDSTTADSDGNWSFELTGLDEGVHNYNVRARYQEDGETAGGLSRVAHVRFFIEL